MKLRVKSVPTSHVPVYECYSIFPKRFVGKQYNPEVNDWTCLDSVVEVENTAEYRAAVKDKDLLPADKATADICQVSFVSKDAKESK